VMMEALADFGTVAAFNITTFSIAIYKAWFALFSLPSALAVAALMLSLVVIVAHLERRARQRQRFASDSAPGERLRLSRGKACLATGLCGAVFTLAFVVPIARLLWLGIPHWHAIDARGWSAAFNSLSLGALAAAVVVLGALLLALAERQRPAIAVRAAVRLGTLGYALPGALLAVGLYVPAVELGNRLAASLGLDLRVHGGLGLLLVAYLVRFAAVAYAPLSAALQRVRPQLVEAARSLGAGPSRLYGRVFLPLLRGGLASAALLVLVDVMKEMPMTLMMRPFGWDTLATRVFELSSEGLWAQAALPALAIVAVGLAPVLLLERSARHAA